MTLINCQECDKTVSSAAVACPNCDAPIAAAKEASAAGVQITTTQETGKKLKSHYLLSMVAIIIGLLLVFSGDANAGDNQFAGVGGIFLFVGLVWMLVTRFRIWWHHR